MSTIHPDHPAFRSRECYGLCRYAEILAGSTRSRSGTVPREHRLGPDGLAITQQQWLEALHQRKGILKAVLLDQSVVAGLGNLYIDEICLPDGYSSWVTRGIYPGTTADPDASGYGEVVS